MDISALLEQTQQKGVSDIHLASGNPPTIRVDGELQPLGEEPLSSEAIESMIYSIMTEEQRATYEAEKEIDFSFELSTDARFRVNAFTNRQGAAIVFRAIPAKNPTLDELDAPEIFKRLAELDRGLVLVTGATGCGKSTTLAAMIEYINSTARRHVLIIEDPIEFIHLPKKSLINQREVGRDTKSFAGALRSALREDPDVILVGEMRDLETISLALTAAETGHLVMATLHASSAAKSVDRIIDVFPPGDKSLVRAMLAGSLQAVIAQVLLKRADGNGRIAVFEVLVGTPAVRNLIRENKVPQMYSMMQMGAEFDMQTMSDAIEKLVVNGVVSAEEARYHLKQAADDQEEDESDRPGPQVREPSATTAESKKLPRALRPRQSDYSF